MNCEFCSSPVHVWFQCPKKPDGWKPARLAKESAAARKDVQKLGGSTTSGDGTKKRSGDTGNARLGNGLSEASKLAEIAQSGPAGTQALPVDTNEGCSSLGERPDASGELKLASQVIEAGSIPATSSPKFNKNEYQCRYMREVYRPRLKARNAKP